RARRYLRAPLAALALRPRPASSDLPARLEPLAAAGAAAGAEAAATATSPTAARRARPAGAAEGAAPRAAPAPAAAAPTAAQNLAQAPEHLLEDLATHVPADPADGAP